MADNPHAITEEQKIKARKALLYDAEPVAAPTGPSKPFAVYLRETPAEPLAGPVKAGLWALGAVVLLLLVASVVKFSNRPAKVKKAPAAATTRIDGTKPIGLLRGGPSTA